jgi:hypothetical protein
MSQELGGDMSELEERLRRDAKYYYARVYYASEVVALLDERDKIIAEQRAMIAELSEEPIIEPEILRRANAAQDSVLRHQQQRINAYRRIIAGLCGRLRFFRLVSDIKRRNTW